jgi:hypothetical protein
MKGRHGGVRHGAGRPKSLSEGQEIAVAQECHKMMRRVMKARLNARLEKSIPDSVEEEQKRARAAIKAKRRGSKVGQDGLSADEILKEVSEEIDISMTPGAMPGASVRARSAVAYRNAKGLRDQVFKRVATRWSKRLDKNISVPTVRRAYNKYRSMGLR